jgi:hypothetical protein
MQKPVEKVRLDKKQSLMLSLTELEKVTDQFVALLKKADSSSEPVFREVLRSISQVKTRLMGQLILEQRTFHRGLAYDDILE